MELRHGVMAPQARMVASRRATDFSRWNSVSAYWDSDDDGRVNPRSSGESDDRVDGLERPPLFCARHSEEMTWDWAFLIPMEYPA